jgi:hypothetical protein
MKLPLYAGLKSRDGTLDRDQFMKNVFVEKGGKEDGGVQTFRRPGLSLYGTNTSGVGQGITGFLDPDDNEYLFQANGGTLYNAGVPAPGNDWDEIAEDNVDFTVSGGIIPTGLNVLRFGGLLWLIGQASTSRFVVFYSSDDGVTWTTLVDVALGTSGYPPNAVPMFAFVHDSYLYVVTNIIGQDVWRSADGATWTQMTASMGVSPTSNRGFAEVVSFNGDLYAFVYENSGGNATNIPVYKSTDDGATWATVSGNHEFEAIGAPVRVFYGVAAYNGYLWVVGGFSTGRGQQVWRSSDGVTWAQVGSNAFTPGSTNGDSISLLAAGGVLFAFVCSGANANKIYRTTDGLTWTLVSTNSLAGSASEPQWNASVAPGGFNRPGDSLSSFAYNNGYFFCWCSDNTVRNSLFRLATVQGTVSLGPIGAGILDFAQDYARTLLVIHHPDALYTLATASFTLTEVTDPDYPAETVRGIVYLDGYFFVMDKDGNIYNSAEDDPTSWAGADFIAAEFEPDGGVALAKYQNYVIAFGEYTTELFFNAGNPTNSPLLPVQNGQMLIGCADGDTVGQIDGQLLFVAQSKGQGQSVAKGKFVAQLQGSSYQKISSPDVDRILEADDFTDVDATTFKVAGHSYYQIRLGSSGLSLVFDLSEAEWYVWTRRRDSFTHGLSNVVTANGTATATATHSFADGDVAVISAFTGTHTALNGTYNVIVPSGGASLSWVLSGTSYSGTSSGTGTATGWSEDDFGIVSGAGYQGRQILQDKANGDLYEASIDTFQDKSVYMDWLVRMTTAEDAENKFTAWADLISDRLSGNALLRYSDDDCQNFTKYRARSMAGDRTRWWRLGMHKRRTYDLRVTDAVRMRGQRVDLN